MALHDGSGNGSDCETQQVVVAKKFHKHERLFDGGGDIGNKLNAQNYGNTKETGELDICSATFYTCYVGLLTPNLVGNFTLC